MATQSKKVLLSPDSLIAFIDRGHQKHEQASAFFRFFAQGQYQLFLNTMDLHSIYLYVYQNISPSLAKDFIRTLSLSDINILFPDENDLKATYKTFFTYQTSEMTFPLALSATLANRRNISQVCTFSFYPNLFGLQIFYLPI